MVNKPSPPPDQFRKALRLRLPARNAAFHGWSCDDQRESHRQAARKRRAAQRQAARAPQYAADRSTAPDFWREMKRIGRFTVVASLTCAEPSSYKRSRPSPRKGRRSRLMAPAPLRKPFRFNGICDRDAATRPASAPADFTEFCIRPAPRPLPRAGSGALKAALAAIQEAALSAHTERRQ